jgi:hypothetical protein
MYLYNYHFIKYNETKSSKKYKSLNQGGKPMAKHPLLPFMEAHAKALDTNVKDLTVESLKSLFGHVYYIWRTFKPALGEEAALKYYGNVWAELAKLGFAGAMEKFALKEVKDLPTLGKIVQDCFTGVPALYKTKRNTKNEHVGHVLWCANPAYGPGDCTYCRHDYYRQEVYLTYVYIWELINQAKLKGLKEEILVELPSGRCRDGAACACQIILRTKDADPDRHLPEVENRFVDLEMGKQEPVSYVLKKQKRSFDEQGPASFSGFLAVDLIAFIQLFVNAKPKAKQIYLDLWKTFPPMWVKDAKIDLEIGKVKTAQDLGAIVAYCQKKKYVAFSVEGDDKTAVLTAAADPFVQVAEMFQGPKAYNEALVAMDKDFIENIFKETKMGKKATVKIKSHIAKGDSQTVIEITVK